MAVIERAGERYSIWSLLKHAMGGLGFEFDVAVMGQSCMLDMHKREI